MKKLGLFIYLIIGLNFSMQELSAKQTDDTSFMSFLSSSIKQSFNESIFWKVIAVLGVTLWIGDKCIPWIQKTWYQPLSEWDKLKRECTSNSLKAQGTINVILERLASEEKQKKEIEEVHKIFRERVATEFERLKQDVERFLNPMKEKIEAAERLVDSTKQLHERQIKNCIDDFMKRFRTLEDTVETGDEKIAKSLNSKYQYLLGIVTVLQENKIKALEERVFDIKQNKINSPRPKAKSTPSSPAPLRRRRSDSEEEDSSPETSPRDKDDSGILIIITEPDQKKD